MSPIDPDLRVFLDEVNARQTQVVPTVQERRDAAALASSEFRGSLIPPSVDIDVRDRVIAGRQAPVPVRVYEPAFASDRGRPVVAYIHGGGWVVGTLDSYDPDCARLAERLDATVISIGYRLAPEHPYPAAFEDCLDVVRALRSEEHGALGLAGDSAGATLALAVSLAMRDEPHGDAQLLIYPAIDPHAGGNDSYRENQSGYLLSAADMEFYYRSYLGDGALADEFAAPSRATSVAGVPATVLVSAGFDPLRDEGRALAARLVSDDVEVLYQPNPSLTHGFQQLVPRVPAAERALDRAYGSFRLLLDRAVTAREGGA